MMKKWDYNKLNRALKQFIEDKRFKEKIEKIVA